MAYDPERNLYNKYSENGYHANRPDNYASICRYRDDGLLTLIAEKDRMEIHEGQSIVALRVKEEFLSAMGLDAPPPTFMGASLNWITLMNGAHPVYLAFIPEKRAFELWNHWGKALLDRSVQVAGLARAAGHPVPYETIGQLAKYGMQLRHEPSLRYEFLLRRLAPVSQDMNHHVYANVIGGLLPFDFPHVSGDALKEDVLSLIESGCTSTSANMKRDLRPYVSPHFQRAR